MRSINYQDFDLKHFYVRRLVNILPPYLLASLLLGVLAIGAALLFPVSKHRVSASFVLITLFASALFYLALEELSRLRIPRGPLSRFCRVECDFGGSVRRAVSR